MHMPVRAHDLDSSIQVVCALQEHPFDVSLSCSNAIAVASQHGTSSHDNHHSALPLASHRDYSWLCESTLCRQTIALARMLGPPKGFFYDGTATHLFSEPESTALAINNRGQILVQTTKSQACLWINEEVTPIATLGGIRIQPSEFN